MATNPILSEAARLARMGSAAFGDALAIRRQIRAEISSRGICLCQVDGAKTSGSFYTEAASLDNAVAALAKDLRERKIKPGTAIILNFASDGLKTVSVEIGQGKTYGKIQVLDSTARRDPARLKQQDLRRYCYRAVIGGAGSSVGSSPSKAELLCLEIGPAEMLPFAQKGVRVERFAAPLLWVDFLLERCAEDFEAKTLLGIYDLGRTYFFAIRNGDVSGIRFLDRRAAADVKEIKDTGLNFGFDAGANGRGYKVVFACLTADSSDVEDTAREVLEIVHEVKLLRHEEFFSIDPRLADFAGAPSLPLSLFVSGTGGTVGAGTPLALPFYTAEEANRSQLKVADLLGIRILKGLRACLTAGAIAAPLLAAYHYYKCVSGPEWSVDAFVLRKKEAEVVRLSGIEAFVRKGLAVCNGRIDPGSILGVAFSDLAPTFTLTKVSQAATPEGYNILIAGTSPDDSIVDIEDYARHLEDRAGNLFPAYAAQARITKNDSDQGSLQENRAHLRSFEITLALRRNP